ncbi:2-oxo acid dehydrogenase subunit E2 [Prauserella sp. PE36]|uniref:dihydrolipoamide acetyltransferase family protein n=1 Tax=Prauserella sp. PE36 TaxID=1504709 RepID=UPI000DE35332|nr:dihydrolipoamide acetyltransferase family protein [Prauserella sp. PE36]RBM21899.1 2-oxo acid dehydrogenase subunit E2 [Prauserella sp. PE36]
MPEILRMPEVAANTTEAVVSSWNVDLNTPYAAGEAIVTVETEKAAVDIEAETEGALLRLLADEGQTVAVGSPIAVWGSPGETPDAVDALVATLDLPTGITTGAGSDDERRAEAVPAESAVADRGAGAASPANGGRIFASPIARKLAAEAGLDLAAVVGTGPNQSIRRRDVEAALAAARSAEAAAGGPDAAASPSSDHAVEPATAGAEFEDVPISRMRQAVARRLVDSKHSAPHFYLRGTVRVDRLLDVRRELNDGTQAAISLNDLVVKAVAVAHSRVPGLNVRWNGDSVRQYRQADIAVAVATEHGLVTPVVRGVDTMPIGKLAERTRDLIRRAHDRRLRQHELEGGSITVTNLGMFGTEEFAAIINPPHAAILAVGAASRQPHVVDGELGVATIMRLCLSVDHRPVDGVTAAEWMRELTGIIEHSLQILA